MINLEDYKRYFVFKFPNKDAPMLGMIHPFLLMVLAEVSYYSSKKGYPPLIITRVIDGPIPGVSVSDSHEEGRAIDISVNNLLEAQILDITDFCNNRSSYSDMGAISFSDGKKRLCVDHTGTSRHLHLQVSKEAASI